jgi:hypothetical protein
MADIALMRHLLIALGIGLLIGAERAAHGRASGLCAVALLHHRHAGEQANDHTHRGYRTGPDLLHHQQPCQNVVFCKAGTGTFAARVIPAQAGIVIASWTVGHLALRIL